MGGFVRDCFSEMGCFERFTSRNYAIDKIGYIAISSELSAFLKNIFEMKVLSNIDTFILGAVASLIYLEGINIMRNEDFIKYIICGSMLGASIKKFTKTKKILTVMLVY